MGRPKWLSPGGITIPRAIAMPRQTRGVGRRYKLKGNKTASSYEYNFGMALEKYGIDYLFQVSYWGGHNIVGGLVLDFLVFTTPLWTPVFINGEYAHRTGKRDRDFLQQALLSSQFPNLAEVLELWGEDTATYELALVAVRKHFL